MQGEAGSGDMIVGILALVVAAPFIIGAAILITRMRNARFIRAWAPLIPVIDGKVTNDGSAASTSWLSGRYGGRDVHAAMTPKVRSGHNSAITVNRFEIVLHDVRGQSDWSVVWRRGLPVVGDSGWRLRADDGSLEQRLLDAGTVEVATQLGFGEVHYNSRSRELMMRSDVSPDLAPHLDRFRVELDLMGELAAINDATNAAPAPA